MNRNNTLLKYTHIYILSTHIFGETVRETGYNDIYSATIRSKVRMGRKQETTPL